MKFNFVFEKVLGHKRTMEDIARRDWSEAQAIADKSMRELEKMYAQVDSARVRASELETTGGRLGPELSQIDEFINGQKIRIERHREKVRELLGEAERLQAILVEAAKERKTFEKLKERRLEEYRGLKKKLELKEVDELIVTRFGRKDGTVD